MSSNVSKAEKEEKESESYQHEQDQECDGGEVFVVKGKGKGGFKGTCFKCGIRGHKADRCWWKKARETGRKERRIQRKGMVLRRMVKPWSHVEQFLVQSTLARRNVRS